MTAVAAPPLVGCGVWSPVFCSACSLSPYDIGPSFFKLKLVRWGIGLIVKSICKIMLIGRWFEPRFVFVCQLVEVLREADANKAYGEDVLALPGSLVGDSHLRMLKLRLLLTPT